MYEALLSTRGWDVTDTGCWECRGSPHKQGYKAFKINGHQQYAHRLAYTVWVGPIPEGLVIRHSCDNPPCINPEHLLSGTQRDNAIDRESRGRGNKATGLRNASSKLTPAKVQTIRSTIGQTKALADEFGVSITTIKNVRKGKVWR